MFVSLVVAEKHKNEKRFTWTFSLCASLSDMCTRVYFEGPHDILKINVQYTFSSLAADIFLSADLSAHMITRVQSYFR